MRYVTETFRRQDGVFLVLAVFMVGLYVLTAGGGFPLDDSWIHQTYGRNLAQTGQWAFVPGVPSAASTSPLYTVLLAAGYVLGVNYFFWAHFLGAAALFVTGILGSRMAERLLPEQKHIGLVVGVTLVIAWHLIWSAAAGMETMIFSMMTLALIAAAWRELDVRANSVRHTAIRGLIFGVLTALTVLARPEGIMLAGMVGLVMMVVRPQGWRDLFVWGGGAALSFGVIISPYLLLNLQLTGGLLPNTAAAKEASVPALLALSYPFRLWLLTTHLLAGGQLMLIPGVVYFVWRLRRYDPGREMLFYALPVLWSLGLVALYASRLPVPFQHGRYVIPALPAIIVVGVASMSRLLVIGAQSTMWERVIKRAYLYSTVVVFVAFALVIAPTIYRVDVRIIEEEMVAPAHWIQANLPEDELLALHDIGAVGYFTRRPLLDTAGLITPEVVTIMLDKEAIYDFMQERDARYLMAFPDQLPGNDVDDPRLCRIYITGGRASPSVDGPNMAIYRLVWDEVCPTGS